MQHILALTDFSETANLAVHVGRLWSERFGAQLHLLYWHPKTGVGEDAAERLRAAVPEAMIHLDETSTSLWQAVASRTKAYGVDLIIMGSHGISGKSEHFIGSNTQRVVRMLNCPVLVVKHPLPQLSVKRAVFASQFQKEDLPAFLRFVKLVEPFLPEIELVYVATSLFERTPASQVEAMKKFAEAAKPLTCKAHVVKSFNVAEGVRYLAGRSGADLIAIGNRDRNSLRRIFAGSMVEVLVNHADVPVLAVDY